MMLLQIWRRLRRERSRCLVRGSARSELLMFSRWRNRMLRARGLVLEGLVRVKFQRREETNDWED
jgi:hypothetical protein